jgi:hypothetical protein
MLQYFKHPHQPPPLILYLSLNSHVFTFVAGSIKTQSINQPRYTHTREQRRRPKKDGGAFRDLADLVYDSVLLLMLGIEIFLLSIVPVFGPVISTLFNAWIHSL